LVISGFIIQDKKDISFANDVENCPTPNFKHSSTLEGLKLAKIDELTFQRVITPRVIPRYLFEQFDGMDAQKIDMIYGYAEDIITIPTVNNSGQIVKVLNPLIWFVVLQDISHIIKGFVWFEIDPIERYIYIQAFSVDKEYQSNNGSVNKKLIDYLFSLPIPDDLKQKIVMATNRPNVCQKQGWERSKKVLMEYKISEKKDAMEPPMQNKKTNN